MVIQSNSCGTVPFLCTVKKLCNSESIAKEQIRLQNDFGQKVDGVRKGTG